MILLAAGTIRLITAGLTLAGLVLLLGLLLAGLLSRLLPLLLTLARTLGGVPALPRLTLLLGLPRLGLSGGRTVPLHGAASRAAALVLRDLQDLVDGAQDLLPLALGGAEQAGDRGARGGVLVLAEVLEPRRLEVAELGDVALARIEEQLSVLRLIRRSTSWKSSIIWSCGEVLSSRRNGDGSKPSGISTSGASSSASCSCWGPLPGPGRVLGLGGRGEVHQCSQHAGRQEGRAGGFERIEGPRERRGAACAAGVEE